MKNNKSITIELELDAMAYEGVAIGREGGKVFFIKNGVPGDKVKALITKSKKSFAEGFVSEILEASPYRIQPKCKYFGICGGCSWQNMSYNEQIKWKSTNVKDSFERIGKFSDFEMKNIIGSDWEFQFRNKMEFSFGASRWLTEEEINSGIEIENKNFGLGLHPAGRFDKIIDLDYCKIQNDYANEILAEVKEYALRLSLSAYNVRTHEGFLRNLIIRHSFTNNNFLVIIITNNIKSEQEKSFIDLFKNQLVSKFDKIISVVHGINDSNNPVKLNSSELLFGCDFLEEKILDINFKISPFSFFQTNSTQLNKFIGEIVETASIGKSDIVWDLFCGAGSITLPAAKFAKEVIGIELSQSSINDANQNAKLNNITNVSFLTADLNNKNVADAMKSLPVPDIIILDPPRAGLSNHLINYINGLGVKKLVYVSCNPPTQARDCNLLSSNYNLLSIQPVDMFPQTYHIENISLLELKDKVYENQQ